MVLRVVGVLVVAAVLAFSALRSVSLSAELEVLRADLAAAEAEVEASAASASAAALASAEASSRAAAAEAEVERLSASAAAREVQAAQEVPADLADRVRLCASFQDGMVRLLELAYSGSAPDEGSLRGFAAEASEACHAAEEAVAAADPDMVSP